MKTALQVLAQVLAGPVLVFRVKFMLAFKRFYIFFLLGLYWLTGASRAQDDFHLQQQETAPENVLALMPPKGKSLGFATIEIDPSIDVTFRHILLHAYVVPPLSPKDANTNPYSWRSTFLDVLVPLDKRRQKLRRLNSVYLGVTMKFAQFTVKWLNQKLHKVPVVVVNAAGSGGFVGGSNNVLIFIKGWNRQPVLQSFNYAGNSIGGVEQTFDDVDERDFMKVTEMRHQYKNTDEGDVEMQLTYYYWNGRNFAARENDTETSGA